MVRKDISLAKLDNILRKGFSYDTWDHLSEFSLKSGRKRDNLGTIYPDGGGAGASIRIGELGLQKGSEMEWVYDFGANVQHRIAVEDFQPKVGKSDEKQQEEPAIEVMEISRNLKS